MANEVVVAQQAVPALGARPEYALAADYAPSDTTKALAGAGFPGKRLSIKGGVFRFIVDGKEMQALEERYLDVVIIRSADHIGRTFYGTSYDEDSPTAPSCWSADGVKPDAKIATPQCSTCAACPQNIKGSGTLEDTRACRFSQRVAVVLANNIEGDVLALTVPAKSLFGKPDGANLPMQAYGQWHVNVNKSKIEDVVTRLKFDLKAESPKLFFKPMRWLEAEEKEVIAKQAQGEDALKAVITSFGMSAPAPAVALPPPMEKPKPKIAAPVVEEEPPAPAPTVGKKRGRPAKTAEAPAHEPVVRAAAPEPELPKRSTAAQVAANWDTDD